MYATILFFFCVFWRIPAGLGNPIFIVGDGGGFAAGLFPAKAVPKHKPFNNFKLTVFLKRVECNM